MSDTGQPENVPEPKQEARIPHGPKCDTCGATMVLRSYRPHPTLRSHELRTYQCPLCSRNEVLSAPVVAG